MFSDAELQLAYKVGNVPFNMFPFPHFYIPDVFPADFYRQLQQNLPEPQAMMPIEEARQLKGYKERFVLGLNARDLATLPAAKQAFWSDFAGWLVGANFRSLVLRKFQPFIDQRFAGNSHVEFYDEALLVQDVTNYKLGPHSDAQRKVVTMLFYLPPDNSQLHLGTSLYLANDPDFTCPGGPHHDRSKFSLLHTNPFAPNSLFAFFKTDNSFHGVEPVADPDCRRWLLLYDIFVYDSAAAEPAAAAPVASSNVKFTF
ncbi:MAG: methyltransferase FkbM family [Proteobacteria bacterium]|nr:methyltransferase FkbM family [Pseudomonadota bacterium]